LQSWVLTNFKIHAILESNAEPWFEDARVKTCAVILQKCDDPAERNAQLVKFVRLDTPLKTILGEGREFRTDELAADLWDSLPDEDKQLLIPWIASEVTDILTVNIPEGHASLPDANDMLDANTIFFRQPKGGKAVTQPLALPSRAHAEMVHLLTQHSIYGAVRLPKTEKAALSLQGRLTARLAMLAAKANELARSRTGDEKRATELAHLLEFWMTHGKPRREAKQKETQEP
jgi:hypothetical protein